MQLMRGALGASSASAHCVCKPAAKRRASKLQQVLLCALATDEQSERRKNPSLYSAVSTVSDEHRVQRAPRVRKPEVLAPAGGWPQLRAAVENGADAVYIGLTAFNARARAQNFTVDELPEVVAYAHARDVKVFVALNVLVFDEELGSVEEAVRAVACAGVDSVIVQDVGLVALVRRVAPNLAVHGSTQMSITSGAACALSRCPSWEAAVRVTPAAAAGEGAEFARQLGCKRVVLGRELSIAEIAKTVAKTTAEVEVFVHGALCVSYSGQCFSSEAWGGRSANRGQCAQACRLPYGLLVNGQLRELGDVKYLLSPQDLMAIEHLPALISSGVSCLKIEGRLKGPEYVALTTQAYRKAVDAAYLAAQQQTDASFALMRTADEILGRDVVLDLHQVFARGQDGRHAGLTPGFLEGPAHQRLVRGRNPRHRGVYLGRVERVRGGVAFVQLQGSAPVRVGDGVVFDVGAPDKAEQGGCVTGLRAVSDCKTDEAGQLTSGLVAFGVDGADLRLLGEGTLVWRTKSAALEGRLRKTWDGLAAADVRRVPVRATLRGAIGSAATLSLADESGHVAEASSSVPVQAASSRAVDEHQIRKALGPTLGSDTVFSLQRVDVTGLGALGDVFIQMSEIKRMRRQAVQRLTELRTRSVSAVGVRGEPVLPAVLAEARQRVAQVHSSAERAVSEPRVTVLCRTRQQAEAAMTVPWLDEIQLDFLEVHGLREAVADVRAAGKRVVVATPRILKPDEQRLWRFFLALRADALLVRSAGFLQQLMDLGGPGALVDGEAGLEVPRLLFGDFSLNVANVVSASTFLSKSLSRLTPTHDLNGDQLVELAGRLSEAQRSALEVVVHQHLPIFHTEHCVFCRFLSDGNSYKDCGHPCEKNTVHLRDDGARDHLVLADMGCRNTVFNAQAQSAVMLLTRLLDAGYRSFRVELVDEPTDSVVPLLTMYNDVLHGRRSRADAWRWLQTLPDANGNAQGCTEGSLAQKKEKERSGLKLTAMSKRNGTTKSLR